MCSFFIFLFFPGLCISYFCSKTVKFSKHFFVENAHKNILNRNTHNLINKQICAYLMQDAITSFDNRSFYNLFFRKNTSYLIIILIR